MPVTPLQFNAEGNLFEYLNKLAGVYQTSGEFAKHAGDAAQNQAAQSQSAAEMMAKFDAALGGATEQEKALAQAVIHAREEMKAQKIVADAMGVSTGDVARGMAKLSKEQAEMANTVGGVDVSKRAFREYGEIIETATGLQISHIGALGQTIATLGPLAIAAIAVGKAVEWWKEKEKESDEVIKTYSESIIKQADALEKLEKAHGHLDPAQMQIIARAREFKGEKWNEEYEKLQGAVDHLGTKVYSLDSILGNNGTAWGNLTHPLASVSALWAVMTGQSDKLREKLEQANAALKDFTDPTKTDPSVQAAQLRKNHEIWVASLGEKERLYQQHVDRINAIYDNANKLGIKLQMESITAENERYRQEEANLAASGKRKTGIKLASIDDFAEKARERHERILADERNLVAKWNNQARADRQREEADRNRAAMAELHAFEKQGEAILKHTRQGKLLWRQQDLAAERAYDRQLIHLAGATAAELQEYDRQTAQMAQRLRQQELQEHMQTAQAMMGIAAGAFGQRKEIAIAQAMMATYESATNAYNSMAVIPIVGPVLGAIAAGLAIAAGVRNVSEIRSQNPHTGGQFHGGGVVPETASYYMKRGEVVLPDNSAQQNLARHVQAVGDMMDRNARVKGNGQTTIINYNATVFDKAKADREMARGASRGARRSNVRAA